MSSSSKREPVADAMAPDRVVSPPDPGEGKDAITPELLATNRKRALEIMQELSPRMRLMIERRLTPGLKKRIDTGDVLHGAYLRLLESLAVKNPGSDEMMRAWVFRSVFNEWHDQRRRNESRGRDVRREVPLPDGSVMILLAGMGVGTNCGMRETVTRIREVIKPGVFDIVWMHAVDGLSHREIANIVGKSEHAVGKCYLRALEKIRLVVCSPFKST